MSELETVTIERRGSIAVVSMNRPEKLNAFDAALRRDMRFAVREVNEFIAVAFE